MLKIKRVRKLNWEIKEVNKIITKKKIKSDKETISKPFGFSNLSDNEKRLLGFIFWEITFSEVLDILNTFETKDCLKRGLINRAIKKTEYDRLKILYLSNDIKILPFKNFNESLVISSDKPRGSPVVYNKNW